LSQDQAVVDTDVASLPQGESSSFVVVLLSALLGGLILNLMPCVLPVLGMKLASVLSAQGKAKQRIRFEFIAVSLGVISAFVMIAVMLSLMKLLGISIGWGVQFQNPYFIGSLLILTALFSFNLFGQFEFKLPSRLTTKAASAGGAGYAGHFVQGVFATVLATPCSAPFLVTAVSVAFVSSIWHAMLIFLMLGVGMALPWIGVAIWPQLIHKLPKPGRWMLTLRFVFGLMMLATSFWLLSILQSFIGTGLSVLVALILLVFLARATALQYGRVFLIKSCALGLIISVLALVVGALTTKHWATPLARDHNWQVFEQSQISSQVAAGKVVFVDVTANWCITCKANKVGVLLQEPVYSRLGQADIQLMRADWSQPSDKISSFLQSYGRFGVPFNIVYGPNAPQGIELPVLLNAENVLSTIEKAKGQP
ncbi:MAG: protein-disulfide reductase DsbD family protein, partial [Vibrio sp.]